MRVAELEGALLDYWVAQIERGAGVLVILRDGACFLDGGGKQRLFAPSLDWAHGGPIIEREFGSVYLNLLPPNNEFVGWIAQMGPFPRRYSQTGSTPLQATMRAYVASKFGDEVPDMADAQS